MHVSEFSISAGDVFSMPYPTRWIECVTGFRSRQVTHIERGFQQSLSQLQVCYSKIKPIAIIHPSTYIYTYNYIALGGAYIVF
jgi:hypothetical protein